MDLLVTLCASHHLNPSEYTVEVLSPNKNNISFKPNSPIGLLEAEKIVLKPRAGEGKIRTPYMPEATVRLLINYNKSHKAVVRVNPRLPLEKLLPVVCDKCEFEVESTVLLRDSESKEPLDLSRTLNEHGLREVYAKDTAAKECTGHLPHTAADVTPTKFSSSSSLQDLTKKEKKKSDNHGLFSLFRKNRKKSEPSHTVSAPTSPGLKSRSASVSTQDVASYISPPTDQPKKRRAPQPPMGASNSTPNNLSTCHLTQRSGDDTLRSTKRRAPPPPIAIHDQDNHVDTAEDSLKSLEELKESEEPESVSHPSLSASSSSPLPPPPSPSSPSSAPPFHKPPDSDRPFIHGKDLSDARTALAKVLTSSLSTGVLVKRLKNSTAIPNIHNGTSCTLENDTEIKSALNVTDLPTENEFEDPADRKGLTTFKVVPSRRESDAEPTQDVPAKEEETEAELEKAEEQQVIPETDQSLKAEDDPDQSERSSPIACPDEGESTSCSPPLDSSSSNLEEVEDIVETTKQNGETVVNDDKVEEKSDQCHETDEGELYFGEEEVEDSHTESNACESKTCDDNDDKQNIHEDNFPPPPPPIYFKEDLNEAKASASGTVTNEHGRSDSETPIITAGDSEKVVPAPSMFAQAVAAAVQRSRLHSTGKTISAPVHQDTQEDN
ncbi:cordon-bleu protein-like 1 isoform X2 [Boleophthalmus pectinirostris]|nr:cordon-bleu protein-like 1 isoform X2 [Boleophthalmus pectinirostris]